MLRSWHLLGPALAVVACGSSPDVASPHDAATPYRYPLDDVLHVNHVQLKGTHNSYHIETAGNSLPPYMYTHAPLDVQFETQGVRSVELDTHRNADGVFEVYHVVGLDEQTTCRLFTDCLHVIRVWSDAHPLHAPLFLHIEPKDGFYPDQAEAYFDAYHAEIRSQFPDGKIILPDDLLHGMATLPEALAMHGWPTLGETRGKVLFYFDNTAELRAAYTHGGKDLIGRLSFVDSAPADPFGAVAVLNTPTDPAIAAALAAGFLVRTRADSDGNPAGVQANNQLPEALASGGNILSTDFPAEVAGNSYFVTIPDGHPVRCNPVTAPGECTSLAIEDPDHLR